MHWHELSLLVKLVKWPQSIFISKLCFVFVMSLFKTFLKQNYFWESETNFNKNILNFCQGSLPPGKISWRNEYQRLTHETPTHLSETLLEHSDEVLDVSFSHDGKLFCTTSKDATVKVRNIIIHLNSSNYWFICR